MVSAFAIFTHSVALSLSDRAAMFAGMLSDWSTLMGGPEVSVNIIKLYILGIFSIQTNEFNDLPIA